MEVSYPVRLSSTLTRVKAMREPSGESCGLATQTKSKMSLSVMERRDGGVEVWAASEVMTARATTKAETRTFMRILVVAASVRRVVIVQCGYRSGQRIVSDGGWLTGLPTCVTGRGFRNPRFPIRRAVPGRSQMHPAKAIAASCGACRA